MYYPSRRRGFYARATVGPAFRETQITTIANFGSGPVVVNLSESTSGVAAGGGIGYEFRLARNLFLTPETAVHVHRVGDDWSRSAVLALGLTWH